MNIDKKALGQRIKSIRQAKGLTMEEFGKFFDNASKGVISNWEKGSNIPNNARLKMIAQFGGISVDELLYGNVEARIKNILLDKPGVDERYIDLIVEISTAINNEHATKDDIFKTYDSIVGPLNDKIKKNVAQMKLAYNIHRSEEFLFDFLKDPSKDLDFSNINFAVKELAEAVSNYYDYFDKTVEEVYNEVISVRQQEK